MDGFTANLWRLISLNAKHVKNYSTEQIPLPQREADPNVEVHALPARDGLFVVGVDDDEGTIPAPVRAYLWLDKTFAGHDDRLHPWDSVEEASAALAEFEPLLTPPEVAWSDIESDAALWLWASQGFAAHRLERVGGDAAPAERDGFVVRFDFMARYPVRAGFAPFGGDAYFDATGRPTRIQLGDASVRPGDPGWAAAKFRFRSSSLVWGQLADHFGRSHYQIVNSVLVSTTRHLPKAHPMRRLLKPFLFRTAAANDFARGLLFAENGFFHRTLSFTWEGLESALRDAFGEQRVESFEVELRRKGVHPDMLPAGIELPYVVEALAFWRVIDAFARDLVGSSAALRASLEDEAMRTWWAGLGPDVILGRDLASGLADVFASFLFTVTAFHAQAQNAQAYVRDPRFASVRLGEGQLMSDRQSNLALAALLSSVGLPTPTIDGDLAVHMPDEGSKAAAHRFRSALRELTKQMEQRNRARTQPYRLLEPARVAASITV